MSEPLHLGLQRPGGRIRYRRVGVGPPLILLHATLWSSRQLRGLSSRLAARFSVISPDRRGSGESVAAAPQPPKPIDVAVHVADLVALIEAEGAAPVTVVGHSYGGCIGLELAARHPDLVEAVFVYEPPYGPLASATEREAMADVGRRTVAAADGGDLGAAALVFMEGVSGSAAVAALSPTSRERIARAGTGAVADATLLGMDPTGLRAIDCPVMVATGALSDRLYDDVAHQLVRHIPDARTRRLEGADHLAPVLLADLVARAILEFRSP